MTMTKQLVIVEYFAEPYGNGCAEHDIKVFAELRFAIEAIKEDRQTPHSVGDEPYFKVDAYHDGMMLRPIGECNEGQWREFRITYQDVSNL